jgi:hypothetical protein
MCHNRACINPTHLYAGTEADDIADADRAGRLRRGELAGAAKLKDADVLAILALLDKGYTAKSIAKQFCVAIETIYNIRLGTPTSTIRICPA